MANSLMDLLSNDIDNILRERKEVEIGSHTGGLYFDSMDKFKEDAEYRGRLIGELMARVPDNVEVIKVGVDRIPQKNTYLLYIRTKGDIDNG